MTKTILNALTRLHKDEAGQGLVDSDGEGPCTRIGGRRDQPVGGRRAELEQVLRVRTVGVDRAVHSRRRARHGGRISGGGGGWRFDRQ